MNATFTVVLAGGPSLFISLDCPDEVYGDVPPTTIESFVDHAYDEATAGTAKWFSDTPDGESTLRRINADRVLYVKSPADYEERWHVERDGHAPRSGPA